MHTFLVSAAAFIVLIGVMVVVHEAGHFIVAKLCGVRVEAFSLGFGPRLFGFKYGDTDYKVCLLPLGGYVKMSGEADEFAPSGGGKAYHEIAEASKDDPGALNSHPRWQRMLIGVAGPMANFALTLLLMTIYYGFINEVPASTMKSATVDWVTPDSAAATAGFQPGDIFTRFDGVDNPDWDIIYDHSQINANQMVPVRVERDGRQIQLSLQIPNSAKGADFDFSDTGISPEYIDSPIKVAEVEPETPAARAGLQPDDKIEAVDGHAFHYVSTLLAYMQWKQGKPMTLDVLRKDATLQIQATPTKLYTLWKLGFAAVPIPIREQPLPLLPAVRKSVGFFDNNSLLVGEVLQRLFTRRLSVKQMMGPVGIAQAAGEAAEMQGWLPKFGLAAEISLQLGMLNLLPFPILDGGMILLLLIESALRHDISIAIKERIYTAAFVVLVAFFAFMLFNDVSKLSLFTHVKP
jgi:regulator of sigma E protease